MHICHGSQLNKADFILKRAISNKSLLERALNLNQKKKDILFNRNTLIDGIEFIIFLQWSYNEKEIVELFESINTQKTKSMIVQRTLQIYKSLWKLYIYHNFKKVDNNFIEIYNELARLKPKQKYWEKPHIGSRFPFTGINNLNYHPI